MLELVRRFSEHLRYEKRASPHTVRAYLSNLDAFLSFAVEKRGELEPAQLDIPLLRSYLASLFEKNEPVTIARKLSAVRAFLRFLPRERLIDENLAMLVKPPKAKKALPSFLTADQAAALVESPAKKSILEVRDAAILEVLYGSGLRVSECVALDVGDLEADELRV